MKGKDTAMNEVVRKGQVALFNGPGQAFELKEFEVRALQPGELLVKNVYTTICGSDLHTFCGVRKEPSPTVLGHEIVGEIVALHPMHTGFDLRGKPLQPGDRITWTVFSSNPQSINSLRGIPQKEMTCLNTDMYWRKNRKYSTVD